MMTTTRAGAPGRRDPATLVHSLEVHQAELELQNAELKAANDELRRANDALVVAESRFRALYEHAPTAYVTIDGARTVVDLNLSAVAVLGGARDALLGATVDLFIDERGRASFRTFVDQVFATGHARCEDVIVVRVDQAPVDAQIDGVMLLGSDAELRRCVLAIVDVTARKLAEVARRQAQDEVLAIVSHDLRGPLNAIGLACDALDSDLSADDHQRCVGAIERATAKCERLIRDLLGVAHIESGRLSLSFAPVDLCELARQAARDLEPAVIASGGTLATALPDEPATVVGDRDRLHQVLSNLIGNAQVHARGSAIELRVTARGDRVVLAVVDHGPGIPAEELPRVFERYRQGRRHHGGAGLGLAIVKGLVEAHHGTVTVSSQLGQGATFEISLPRG